MTEQAPLSPGTPGAAPPTPIKAVPVRHPGRWVAAAVIVVLVAMFVHMLLTNEAFQWEFMFSNMFIPPVLIGVRTTLLLTVLSMIIGVFLGIVLALMRLSGNPVLAGVAWTYTWFFRAVPRLVLAVLFGNLGILYATVSFGLPFDMYWLPLLGLDGYSTAIFSIDARTFLSGFMAGLLALALSEGAYMAEIVRAGLQSVDKGQTEAAQALGMRHFQVMRRITLPQALRVIVPPTGNETVAMLKDTALVAFVPVTTELFFQLQNIGARTFQAFPMLVAACIWYLAITSLFMIGQYFLERSFTKGDRQAQAELKAIETKAGN
ncbi:amino acid ABC transporter permease [Nocardiopsis gilva]|nr:amino acid ABC transporter permease [Nocardiopsis gilva]